jgi:DNA invertase Pin-like site-specific DNA recombinase
MGWLRNGDHLVVVAVDRLGRSVREVATALHELTTRGVYVRSLREGVDTSTPTGRAVTSIMATIAELELELGKEPPAASREARIVRGLAATKPMKFDGAQQKRLLRLYQQGEPVSELTTMFGISRSTLFRTLRVLKKQNQCQREQITGGEIGMQGVSYALPVTVVGSALDSGVCVMFRTMPQ